jgi:hypothetical protein
MLKFVIGVSLESYQLSNYDPNFVHFMLASVKFEINLDKFKVIGSTRRRALRPRTCQGSAARVSTSDGGAFLARKTSNMDRLERDDLQTHGWEVC